jgi:hypothetical protein
LPEIQRGLGEAVAEGVTKQRVLLPNSQAMQPAAVTDVSQGQRPAHALMPNAAVQVPPALLERLQQLQQQQQQGDVEMADAEGTRQQHGSDGPLPQQQQQQQGLEPYLVPACAAWFRWDGIAEVEAAHFKDFLGLEGGNAERYRQYRNAIINKYRWVVGGSPAALPTCWACCPCPCLVPRTPGWSGGHAAAVALYLLLTRSLTRCTGPPPLPC